MKNHVRQFPKRNGAENKGALSIEMVSG